MAVNISATDVKYRLSISVSTYDTAIGAICTEVSAAVNAAVDPACGTTYDNVLKHGAISIAAGESLNALRRMPGWSESLTLTGGLSIGENTNSGDEMIKLGWDIIRPYLYQKYQELLADRAEWAYKAAMAAARDDHAADIAEGEKDKVVNEAALLAAQELKVDAQTALLGVQKDILDAKVADTTSTAEINSASDIDFTFALDSKEYS